MKDHYQKLAENIKEALNKSMEKLENKYEAIREKNRIWHCRRKFIKLNPKKKIN